MPSLKLIKLVISQPFILNSAAGMRNIRFLNQKALEHEAKVITKAELRSAQSKLQLCSLAVRGFGYPDLAVGAETGGLMDRFLTLLMSNKIIPSLNWEKNVKERVNKSPCVSLHMGVITGSG